MLCITLQHACRQHFVSNCIIDKYAKYPSRCEIFPRLSNERHGRVAVNFFFIAAKKQIKYLDRNTNVVITLCRKILDGEGRGENRPCVLIKFIVLRAKPMGFFFFNFSFFFLFFFSPSPMVNVLLYRGQHRPLSRRDE